MNQGGTTTVGFVLRRELDVVSVNVREHQDNVNKNMTQHFASRPWNLTTLGIERRGFSRDDVLSLSSKFSITIYRVVFVIAMSLARQGLRD